jgi:hypothetical protein
MSSSAQKTDAPDDASIPVLTERLTLPPLELDTTLPLELPPETGARVAAPLALDTSVAKPPPQPAPPRSATPLPLDTSLPSPPPPLRPGPPAASRPAPAAAPVPAAAGTSAAAPSTSSHWTRIELELRSSILQAIADALPQHIDSIVRSRMSDAIDRMVAQLSAETRLAVAASLRDIVDHAVRTELARLRRQKP